MRWWWLFVCVPPLLAAPAAARALSDGGYQDDERPYRHYGRHGYDDSLSLGHGHGRHAHCRCDARLPARLGTTVLVPSAVQAWPPLGPAPTAFRYRCDTPPGYFPAVTRCLTPWQEVVTQPVP